MLESPDRHQLQIIGRISSPFTSKFGIPRQAGLLPGIKSRILMLPPFDDPLMFEGLASFSHIWVSFLFHQVIAQGWRGRVRPPRLGGNERVGVFATRSPFRPNHLGLSAVRLTRIDTSSGLTLEVEGGDWLDGTPVVDIKPYIPFADAMLDAVGGFAEDKPGAILEVRFSSLANEQLARLGDGERLAGLIHSVLALDPRPAYHSENGLERVYGMRLEGYNLRWQVLAGVVSVLDIEPVGLETDLLRR